jgi:DNA repair ATPase RecN
MKFETRIEAKIVIPILVFLLAQLTGAIAWGYSIGQRLSSLERAAQSIEKLEDKIDNVNQNILDLAKEIAR